MDIKLLANIIEYLADYLTKVVVVEICFSGAVHSLSVGDTQPSLSQRLSQNSTRLQKQVNSPSQCIGVFFLLASPFFAVNHES